MGRLSKASLKLQKEVRALLERPEPWSPEEIDWIYENYDPAMDDNVTERGVFFTPLDLAMDAALFTNRNGHLVDMCAGIGGLSFSLLTRNFHHETIKSITLVEFNPVFTEMSRRLLSPLSAFTESRSTIDLHFVNGSVWNPSLWSSITSGLTEFKLDTMLSNPPYGKCSPEERQEASWMHYQGERELMAIELAWRYAQDATMIIPPGSCEFRYSGRPYYDRQASTKVDRFRKKMPETFTMHMECDGVDTSIFHDEWKGTKITTEVASITFGSID
jgi:hypothetical protein